MERWTKARKSEREDQMAASVYKKKREQKGLKENVGQTDMEEGHTERNKKRKVNVKWRQVIVNT